MIISASRRTDIPAFYGDWFMNRIREGFVLVRNPMNKHQISRIPLNTEIVDCIVFWTKNPSAFVSKLQNLNDWKYYFQFTLTSYDQNIEINVPKKHDIIETFIKISSIIGKQRVIWRYDPILLTENLGVDYHLKYFEYLARKLSGYTEKCVISFVDLYAKCQRNMKQAKIIPMSTDDKLSIAKSISEVCSSLNITVETCSEDIELAMLGIHHGKCIDDKLIETMLGVPLDVGKDKMQREVCGCVSSIDVGEYNTCLHNCLYCYANFSKKTVENNVRKHSAESAILVGSVGPNDKITDRKVDSCVSKQRRLFQ